MSRSYWSVHEKTGSGNSWQQENTIARPNDNFVLTKFSTQTKTPLADGSNAYMTPSTKYLDDPLVFVWYEVSSTIKTLIEGYIDNQTNLKIIDDLSNEFVGRFININSTRLVGKSTEIYDIRSTFERQPGLE